MKIKKLNPSHGGQKVASRPTKPKDVYIRIATNFFIERNGRAKRVKVKVEPILHLFMRSPLKCLRPNLLLVEAQAGMSNGNI